MDRVIFRGSFQGDGVHLARLISNLVGKGCEILSVSASFSPEGSGFDLVLELSHRYGGAQMAERFLRRALRGIVVSDSEEGGGAF